MQVLASTGSSASKSTWHCQSFPRSSPAVRPRTFRKRQPLSRRRNSAAVFDEVQLATPEGNCAVCVWLSYDVQRSCAAAQIEGGIAVRSLCGIMVADFGKLGLEDLRRHTLCEQPLRDGRAQMMISGWHPGLLCIPNVFA